MPCEDGPRPAKHLEGGSVWGLNICEDTMPQQGSTGTLVHLAPVQGGAAALFGRCNAFRLIGPDGGVPAFARRRLTKTARQAEAQLTYRDWRPP